MPKNDPFVAPHNCFRLRSDWPWEFSRPRPKQLPVAGDLVFYRPVTGGPERQRIWSEINQGYPRYLDDLDLEPHPPLTSMDFDALLKFYLLGGDYLPNFEFADNIQQGLDTIASWGGAGSYPRIAHVRVPGLDRDHHTTWARVFLGYTQGGKLDGTGILIYYLGWRAKNWDKPQIARFALCRHEKRTGFGANPQRGWHPGSCTRCGLNMTVDSSD